VCVKNAPYIILVSLSNRKVKIRIINIVMLYQGNEESPIVTYY